MAGFNGYGVMFEHRTTHPTADQVDDGRVLVYVFSDGSLYRAESDGTITKVGDGTGGGPGPGPTEIIKGTESCVVGQSNYTIIHNENLLPNEQEPFISLTIPDTGETIYTEGVLNITPNSFDVVLSDAPAIANYEINWFIPTNSAIADISGAGFTPIPGEGMDIVPSASNYIFSVIDYISSTEVASISGNLQTQIDNISAGPGVGTEITAGGVPVSALELSGGIMVSIVPDTSGAYDLGSPEKPFRDVYISNNSLYLGLNKLSALGGELQFNGNTVQTKNLIAGEGIDIITNVDDQTISVIDYIGKTEVVAMSAQLQTQIDNVSGGTAGFTPLSGEGMIITPSGDDYTFEVSDYIGSTEVASISGSLQTQIDGITGDAGFTPLAGEGLNVSPEGDDYRFSVNDYVSKSEVAEVSGNLQTQIDGITGTAGFTPLSGEGMIITPSGDDYTFEVSDYIGSTEVASISGSLQTQIDNISAGPGGGTQVTADTTPLASLELNGGIPTSLVPDTSAAYDLGSVQNPFSNAYLKDTRLHVEDSRLHVNDAGVFTEDNIIVAETSEPTGGVDGDIWFVVNATGAPIPVGGGTDVTANGVSLETLELSGGISTSLVPDTSGAYDLGNSDLPFSSVHIGPSELNTQDNRLHVNTSGVYTEDNITISTSSTPTGGEYGDIWYTYSISGGVDYGTIVYDNGTPIETLELSGGIPTSIVPDVSGVYDLGSPEKPFKDLYLTENSIHLGDEKISTNNGKLEINDSPVYPGGNITVSTAAPSGGVDGDIWYRVT